MIVGSLGEGQEPDGAPVDWSITVADALAGFSWPLAWGLESGHAAPNRTLPVGLPARLEGGRLLLGDG
jgi:muramoyltetrapeptide carboxypeptidase LdcA involved in peptidoglycan recycling